MRHVIAMVKTENLKNICMQKMWTRK